MNQDIKVKDEPSLVRVAGNPAVISNTNIEEYQAFMAKRRAALDSKERLSELENRMDGIEDKLSQILNAIQQR